jgi:hypothetical protein
LIRYIAGACAVAMACAPKYTPADRAGDLGAESMLNRIFELDAGPQVRSYSRAGLCAVQGNLARHDAGRLAGKVECIVKRSP